MTLRNRLFIIFMMLGAFLVVGQLYLTLPLLNIIALEYYVSQGQAVMVGSFFGIAYAIGFLVFGPLSDRLGRKRVIIGGLIATAVVTLLLSYAAGFDMVLFGRIVQGVVAAALSLIADQLPLDKRAIGISLISLAFLIAAPLMQIIVVRSGLNFSGILSRMAPLYIVVMVGSLMCCDKGVQRHQSKNANYRTLFKDSGIWTVWLVAMTVLFSFVFFYSGAEMRATTQGVDVQLLRLISMVPLSLALTVPMVIKKYSAPKTAFLGLILISFALLVAALNLPITWIIASLLMSAGVAYALPGLIATTASRSNSTTCSTAMAIYSFTSFTGASLAAPLAQLCSSFNSMLFWLVPISLAVSGCNPSKHKLFSRRKGVLMYNFFFATLMIAFPILAENQIPALAQTIEGNTVSQKETILKEYMP